MFPGCSKLVTALFLNQQENFPHLSPFLRLSSLLSLLSLISIERSLGNQVLDKVRL